MAGTKRASKLSDLQCRCRRRPAKEDPRQEWLEQDKAIRKAIAAENATKSVKPRPVPYTGNNSTVIDSSSDPFGDIW
jgi:hypothetical protein